MMNTIRTGLLMAGLTGLFLVAGFLAGGQVGAFVALVFAVAGNLFAYWNSDRMVLAMYGARDVNEQTAPELVHLVRQLSRKAGLPMPRICIVDNEPPNAFATGRNPEHAAVCVTSGLLRRLNSEELAGVLAHELGHVRSRDTLSMTLAAAIAGAGSMLAKFAFSSEGNDRNPSRPIAILLAMLVAPTAEVLARMVVDSNREFEADRLGAEISGQPLWLVSALQRISCGSIDNRAIDTTQPAAPRFIANSLHGGLSALFASHPSTEERIARLRIIAAAMGQTPGLSS